MMIMRQLHFCVFHSVHVAFASLSFEFKLFLTNQSSPISVTNQYSPSYHASFARLHLLTLGLLFSHFCPFFLSFSDIRNLPFPSLSLSFLCSALTVASIPRSGFASVLSNVGVKGGKWYFEVNLLTTGLVQIGWAIGGAFKGDAAAGDVPFTFVFEPFWSVISGVIVLLLFFSPDRIERC